MSPVIDKIWLENLIFEVDAHRIRQALALMPGVITIQANTGEGWIAVEHTDTTDLERIYIRLAEIGHPAADTVAPLQWNL